MPYRYNDRKVYEDHSVEVLVMHKRRPNYGWWDYGTFYQHGIGKPHYPVPAIYYELEYGWTTLVLFQPASDCMICHDYWEMN